MNYRAKFFTSIPLQHKSTEGLVGRWRVNNGRVLHARSIERRLGGLAAREEGGRGGEHTSLLAGGQGCVLCAVWWILPAGLPPALCFFQSALCCSECLSSPLIIEFLTYSIPP